MATPEDRGNALALALIASVIVFATMMSITAVATQESAAVSVAKSLEAARFIAEAGVNLTAIEYQEDGTGPTADWSSSAQPFGGGTYQVLSDQLLPGPELRRTVLVEATLDTETYRVEAVIGPEVEPLFAAAIQANGDVNLDRGSTIDSYDNRAGPYDPLNPGDGGDILSNGDLNMSRNAMVKGSVQVAGTITQDGTTSITGTAEDNGDGVVLDPVDALVAQMETDLAATNDNASLDPTIVVQISGQDAVDIGSFETKTISTGEYYLHSFIAGQTATILFDTSAGPINIVVHTGHWDVGAWSNLQVTGDSRVTIYMSGNNYFQMQQASSVTNPWGRTDLFMVVINSNNLPTNVGDGARFELMQDNVYYGTVWAPGADIHLHQGTQIYGAIIANFVQIDQAIGIHYDRSQIEKLWKLNYDSYKVYWQRREI